MQGTADFHHHVAYPVFPHAYGLFEHTAAFDTAVDRFDTHPAPRDLAVVRLLLWRQCFPTWLLRGLEDSHPLHCEPLKAQVLQQLTPRRQRIGRDISYALVVDAARRGLTQEHDA